MYDEIFMDNYFDNDFDYDEANEVTLGAIVVGGATLISIIRMIHKLKKLYKNGDVVNVKNMVRNGMDEDYAQRKADQAIEFLASKGFISRELSKDNDGVIHFNDLNDDGKAFVSTYYDAVGKVSQLDVEKLTKKKLAGKTFKNVLKLSVSILEVLAAALGMTLSGAVPFIALCLIFSSSFNLTVDLAKLFNGIHYKQNLPSEEGVDEIEDAFAAGYAQALEDFGYESDDYDELPDDDDDYEAFEDVELDGFDFDED